MFYSLPTITFANSWDCETLMVFLKENLKKLILKKISRLQKAIKITQKAKSLGLLQTVGTQGKARIFLLVDLQTLLL